MPTSVAAMIDTSLLEHWQQKRASREQARSALPASWRDDPRPQMQEVCETYVEAMLCLRGDRASRTHEDAPGRSSRKAFPS